MEERKSSHVGLAVSKEPPPPLWAGEQVSEVTVTCLAITHTVGCVRMACDRNLVSQEEEGRRDCGVRKREEGWNRPEEQGQGWRPFHSHRH